MEILFSFKGECFEINIKTLRRKGGFCIVFFCILLSFFPINLVWNSGRTNIGSSFEEKRNLIITQIFQNKIENPKQIDSVYKPNNGLLNKKSNSGFLSIPNPPIGISSTACNDTSLRKYNSFKSAKCLYK